MNDNNIWDNETMRPSETKTKFNSEDNETKLQRPRDHVRPSPSLIVRRDWAKIMSETIGPPGPLRPKNLVDLFL